MRELRLIFHSWERPEDFQRFYYKIEWPPTSHLLIARLDTFDAGKPGEVTAIDSRFILANTPQDSKIFFAIQTTKENTETQKSMQLLGDPFQEIIRPVEERRSWFSRALLRSNNRKERVLVASTRSPEIISNLFEEFDVEWYMESQFWLFIANRDPRNWVEQLVNLSGPKDERLIRHSTIEDSYCIITTLWEHGMDILSDKISRPQLEETARKVSYEKNIPLVIEEGKAE